MMTKPRDHFLRCLHWYNTYRSILDPCEHVSAVLLTRVEGLQMEQIEGMYSEEVIILAQILKALIFSLNRKPLKHLPVV